MAFQGEGRLAAFGGGATGGNGSAPPPDTMQDQVSRSFQANSVLQLPNVERTGNAMSPKDQTRILYGGGLAPTSNGMSESTHTEAAPLMSTTLRIGS